jgi:membrane protease YdiL (CAAX protease family)
MNVLRNRWLWAYFAIYAALLSGLVKSEGLEPAEPLFILAILGIGFSLLALLCTRGLAPLAYEVRAPKAELVFLCLWLLVITGYFVLGKSAVDAITKTEPGHMFLGTLVKLALFVAAPGFILVRWQNYSWADLTPASLRVRNLQPAIWLSLAMLVFQAVFGRGLREIREAHVSWPLALAVVPLAFIWLAVDAGLVEEFFFRALLQTRLARVLRSEVAGIVVAAILFGLVHAPGLYLRPQTTGEGLSHPSLLFAIGYSVVIVSVAGLFLGTLWARTRNLAVVVVVHAATDLLPNLVDFMRGLHILR